MAVRSVVTEAGKWIFLERCVSGLELELPQLGE